MPHAIFEQCFIAATIGFAIVQLILAVICFRSDKRWSSVLGAATVAAMVVLISYLTSVCVHSYLAFSIWSSVYFASIDVMLFFFLHYMTGSIGLLPLGNPLRRAPQPPNAVNCPHNCGGRSTVGQGEDCAATCKMAPKQETATRSQLLFRNILLVLAVMGAADVVSLLSNPLTDFTISYAADTSHLLAHWVYVPHLLYSYHLFYTYLMVALVCGVLVFRIVTTPASYHGRYVPTLLMILGIVFINAVFLFIHWLYLDLSVVFYAFAFVFVYWINFHYRNRALQKRTQDMILNAMGHPVVFFDNEQNFCMSNDDADFLTGHLPADFTLDDFVTGNGLQSPLPPCRRSKNRSFTWVREGVSTVRSSFRCDFRVLRDDHDRIIGYLLVFIDNSLEMDTLTGFPTKAVLQSESRNLEHVLPYPISAAVFDLNRLMLLNNTLGREVGDKAVRLLADNMRLSFPESTLFNRLDDANLLALCPSMTTAETRLICQQISRAMGDIDLGLGPLEVQSAIATIDDEHAGLLTAVTTAVRSLRARKMLDQDSAHSSLLDSLAQTLHESDGTTEAHVQRTRIMGAKLGEKLGLSDFEQSSLALLCLLHDIGKLGIPLDVLNKPGKLSDEEWDLMKSHVDKGYRIAKASDELKDIAPFIRHHHECWDGNGYPDGLKHEAIPLLSRIIAVVDTYDAMVNDRPYRRAVPKREACGELMRCAGTQFDPYLVSVFIEMLEESGELDGEPKIDPSSTAPIAFRPRSLDTYDLAEAVTENMDVITFTEYTLDSENYIIRIDDEFTKLTGYTEEDLGSGDHRLRQVDLLFPEDADRYRTLVGHELSKRQEAFIEHRIRRKDGSERHVFCLGRPFFDPISHEPRSLIIATDIASTKALDVFVTRAKDSAQRSLDFWEHGARIDSLTGILNHESFKSEVRNLLAAKKHKVLFAILDIDNFKGYNDTYGHPRGDELIKTVALMTEASLPAMGFAGRMGGDEFAFAVPMPVSVPEEDARRTALNTWSVVSRSLSRSNQPATLSMGALVMEPGDHFNDAYDRADEALYRAKESGRNQLVFL